MPANGRWDLIRRLKVKLRRCSYSGRSGQYSLNTSLRQPRAGLNSSKKRQPSCSLRTLNNDSSQVLPVAQSLYRLSYRSSKQAICKANITFQTMRYIGRARQINWQGRPGQDGRDGAVSAGMCQLRQDSAVCTTRLVVLNTTMAGELYAAFLKFAI